MHTTLGGAVVVAAALDDVVVDKDAVELVIEEVVVDIDTFELGAGQSKQSSLIQTIGAFSDDPSSLRKYSSILMS